MRCNRRDVTSLTLPRRRHWFLGIAMPARGFMIRVLAYRQAIRRDEGVPQVDR